jgi:hypothetical protein
MRYIGIDAELDRPRIQALRAAPPGYADEGPRRRVFGAALEQWDALLGGSRAIGPAASPILLFYALSQAGRALCAAHIPDQQWNPIGHGLKVRNAGGTLGDTVVEPEGGTSTSFALLCRAVGDRPLSAPTTLGALWAANPQLNPVVGLGEEHPRVLNVSRRGSRDTFVSATIYGPVAEGLPSDLEEARDVLVGRLDDQYPGPHADLQLLSVADGPDGNVGAEVKWIDSDGCVTPLEEIAPGLVPGPGAGSYLRPSLNGAADVLGVLALWWATLLALSSVARYSPDRWAAALARDRSVAAIPVEEALQVAQEILPYVLLGVLTGD